MPERADHIRVSDPLEQQVCQYYRHVTSKLHLPADACHFPPPFWAVLGYGAHIRGSDQRNAVVIPGVNPFQQTGGTRHRYFGILNLQGRAEHKVGNEIGRGMYTPTNPFFRQTYFKELQLFLRGMFGSRACTKSVAKMCSFPSILKKPNWGHQLGLLKSLDRIRECKISTYTFRQEQAYLCRRSMRLDLRHFASTTIQDFMHTSPLAVTPASFSRLLNSSLAAVMTILDVCFACTRPILKRWVRRRSPFIPLLSQAHESPPLPGEQGGELEPAARALLAQTC